MITPLSPTSEIKSEGIEDSMGFMLDPAATAHILNMLRSGVYKDPKMACVREYWCNARDAVIEAGKDPSKHVFITLPNRYEPYLKIRDEGVGLSETDFRRVFRKYGASTKRESNETIGCLGIGSKSAFSYSDTYTVTAIKQGIKRVFIASVARNSTAKDGIGNLNRVLEIDTEESNGVEVSIPVKDTDFYDFQNKVQFFLSFIPVDQRPIVRGINQSLIEIPEREGKFSGANWKVTSEGSSYAIMGGVPYNLDTRSMDLLDEQEKALIDIGVDIVFPIGSFEFAISREEMRYTELSQQVVKAELQKIIQSLADEIGKNFASAKNIWEAKYIYYRVYHNTNSIESKLIRNCFKDNQKVFLQWNNQPITNNSFSVGTLSDKIAMYSCGLAWDGKVDKNSINHIDVKEEKIANIVIHDAKRYGEWQRVSSVLNKLKTDNPGVSPHVFVIRFDCDKAKDTFFKEYDFNSIPLLLLSTFERDRTFSKAARQHSRSFEFNPNNKTLNKENSWDAEECDLDAGGIYVALKKGFYIENPSHRGSITPEKIEEIIESLKAMGKPVDVVWGFKPSIVGKLDHTKWTNLISYFLKETKQYLADQKAFARTENSRAFSNISNGRDELVNIPYSSDEYKTGILPKIVKVDSLFRKFLDAHTALEKALEDKNPHEDLIELFEGLGGDSYSLKTITYGVSQEVQDFEKLAKEVAVKYPMLRISHNVNDYTIPLVADYINEKDA